MVLRKMRVLTYPSSSGNVLVLLRNCETPVIATEFDDVCSTVLVRMTILTRARHGVSSVYATSGRAQMTATPLRAYARRVTFANDGGYPRQDALPCLDSPAGLLTHSIRNPTVLNSEYSGALTFVRCNVATLAQIGGEAPTAPCERLT